MPDQNAPTEVSLEGERGLVKLDLNPLAAVAVHLLGGDTDNEEVKS